MKTKVFFVFGLFTCILFLYLSGKQTDKINRRLLEDLDLKLRGRVSNVDNVQGFNGTGIIDVVITHSNIEYYDPRGKEQYYYCIIKNGIAEFYDGNASQCSPGDIIEVDTKKKLFTIIGRSSQYQQYSIFINTSESFYKYVREKHQKF